MKRGKPLTRSAPLRSASRPLSRSQGLARPVAALKRQGALERVAPRRKAKISPRVRAEVKVRSLGRCIVCRGRGHQLHHVFDEAAFPALAKLAANLVLVCVRCHDRHTLAFERIPADKLPDCTLALGAVCDLGWYVARFYSPG